MRLSLIIAVAIFCVAGVPSISHAVDPFEVQVYEGDINDPGQAGLELHTNYTASGRKVAEYPGEATPHRLLRTTIEPSFALTSWWELGAYLQFATATKDVAEHFGGFKLRSKFIAPRSVSERLGGLVLGLNIEVGRGAAAFGGTDWDTEIRPILAYATKRWFFALNPILGWALTGDTHAAPAFEPAGKIRFDTGKRVGIGVEYFAGLGRLNDVGPFQHQEHVVYVVGDLLDGPVELNIGVGRGLTDATDDWTVKTIVGKTF